jgi:hypothetical protein
MSRGIFFLKKWTLVVGLLGLLAAAPAAIAEVPPPELDPTLSLTGNCSGGAVDPVPDPSCPYSAPPAGPSGRFEEPRAIAVDPFGNEYVASWANSVDAKGRVDVFDDEGKFLTEVAVPNAQSISVDGEGNLYVFEDTGTIVRYSPSEYAPEAGDIAYGNPPVEVTSGFFAGALAVDLSTGRLFVVQDQELTIYRSAAESEPNAVFDEVGVVGHLVEAIAVDAQRERVYLTSCKGEFDECGVKVLEAKAPYSTLKEIYGPPDGEFATLLGRTGLAVDEETGDFFVADIASANTVYQFSEDFEYLSALTSSAFQYKNWTLQIAVSNGEKPLAEDLCEYPDNPTPPLGDACNRHYLFVPVPDAGRALAFEPSDVQAPEIFGVATNGISETEVELQATIDPHGAATTYRFEYATLATFEAEGFAGAAIAGEGTIPGESLTTQVDVQLSGLTPGEAYRFRVVAENEVGKAAEEGQNEGTFTTYEDADPQAPVTCENQALRIGPSASLPDCRAYELVTPAETNGRAPRGVGYTGSLFTTVLSSPAGDAVWFKIEGGSLPDTSGVGGFLGDPYVARRGPSGWVTDLAGPTGEEATEASPASVSPDQGYLFWRAAVEGPLVIPSEPFTEYLYYPDGHSDLIGRGSLGTAPRARGKLITENASHVVFETINDAPDMVAPKLEPDAPPEGTRAVYDRTIDPATGAEETHVVSLLPGDVTPEAGEHATYVGASKDGEGIAFSIGSTLYLRVGNETTYEVGENVTFAGVSEGGERIFYVEGKNLKALDTTGPSPEGEVVNFSSTGDVTPVNVSTDGSRAYFVSPSVLGGSNPVGDSAQAGKQNLYLSEEGATVFVATVTDRDVEGGIFEGNEFDGLGLWTKVGHQIARDPSRLNPNGSVLLFQSRAEITGYPESEFPQIYRYDSDAGDLQCISCVPTGVDATGGAALESYTFDTFTPKPFSPNGFIPNLTPKGDRVFFESTEALVSTDTDEVRDVYEWEEAGAGSCTRPDGCVYLISSGQSARDNFLYAHSTSGDDVFFTTGDALIGSDRDGTSIYDAKVGGGFPGFVPPPPCTADGCRPTVDPSPSVSSPVSPIQGESGNVKPSKSNRCPKGKRRVKKNGKVRCVKKKKHGGKAKKRAGANRRAGK